MAFALRQMHDIKQENVKPSKAGGKNFFKVPDVKTRPALGSIQNTFVERNVAMKPKPSAFKSISVSSTYIPSVSVPPVVQPAPMVKEEPKNEERPPPSPESMDIGEVAEAFTEQLMIDDIDSQESDNPQLCGEYAKDIYKYLRELEIKYHVEPTYMKRQTEIDERMRRILIDWLIQVHNKFTLLQETLYLTVSIVDRYLARNSVAKAKLQLVGVTAMLIASKYEEMYAPEVRDFVFITAEAYSSAEIREKERDILKDLEYSFGNPLCLHFLRRYSRAGDATPEIHTMAKFLMELCLVDYNMLQFVPSRIAAAALYISQKLNKCGEWNATLQHYSTYSESSILPCVREMAYIIHRMPTSKQNAVRTKYSSSKFLRVAKNPVLQSSIIKDLITNETGQ